MLCASPLTVVFLLLVHPLALALLVLDAPVATALQVLALPVVILLLVIECPLGMQAGIVHALLVLDAHNLCYRVALYLIVCESIFKGCQLVIFDQTALLDINERFVFFLLTLCLAQAFLSVEQQDELLHLVVVEQLVTVKLLQGITQLFFTSSLVDGLFIGLLCKAVAELACTLQETEFLLAAIELAFYGTKTLKIGTAVCNLQYPLTLDAKELFVDCLLDANLQVVQDRFWQT